MRVISQDKTYSVDFDHTAFWCQSHCIYAKVGNENVLFAAYKTDDRMKEVFQEMHDAYDPPLPKMPEFAPGASCDDIIAEFNNQVKATPAVLNIPHEEGCEYVYNPCMIYYLPEE